MTGPRDASPGDLPILEPPQRVSGMRVPSEWTLPGKPAGLSPAADDAWRQTNFLLADDLALIAASLSLQVRLAATGYAPRARTMRMAALASLWSRAFTSLSDATTVVRRGGYQSAFSLVRQAIEHVAAQSQLPQEWDAFRIWSHQAYARLAETRAEEVGLGHYFAGEAIAADEQLRAIYRAASDFARPNFGPTALLVAGEASHERYPLVFADEAFHLGWAQLLFGWVLRVGARQLHVALHGAEHFPAGRALRDEVIEHVRAAERRLAMPDRCRLEEHLDAEGRRRHLLVDFRRRPADAPRRLLL